MYLKGPAVFEMHIPVEKTVQAKIPIVIDFFKFLDAIQHVFGFISDSIDVEIEEIMEMRLRRHAKGDGPWEEEQEFQLPDASGGGSSFRREAQCVKSTSQVSVSDL